MAQQEEIVLWIDQRWKRAIEKHLNDETLQEHLENVLDELCNQLPEREYERISRAIQSEAAAQRAEEEAARTYAAYHVTERGQEWYFKTSPGEELLAVGKKLRGYLTQGNGVAPDKFIGMFFGGQPITAKEFDALTALRMENTGKVRGVFDVNFDKCEFSAVHIMDGWQTWAMRDVSVAVYHATRSQFESGDDKIMSNTAWTMAGIFADKGITGTSAKKREDFMRMIRHCRQKKIDVILTKSVSRFSRNTVDCLYYIRALKQLGIAVIFEKENINSLEEDSELRITLSGAFAQSESESISTNVTWGKRRAMEAGKVSIQYKKLYGYRKGEDGQPEIIPEQAEVVRWLYERYLTGASLRMIKDELEQQGVKCFEDSPEWTISRIRSILQNEKYCGDVLMQKTFRQDFINRKAIKNTGQLPMYLIENHHEGIVSREKYDAVQAEMARRNAAKSPSKNAVTGMSSYASKYALSERLVCGECGTLYRRCTWTRNGEKRVVWRCVSRLDYGKKYCHNSPTLDEAPLQQAILAVLNTAMADKNSLIRQITAAMETELIPFPGGTMSLGDIERRLRELEQQFQTLLEKTTDDPAAYGGQFKEILDEQTFLKEKRSGILADNSEQAKANQRILDAAQTLENASLHITEWDESAVRQLVETVKVLSKDEIAVTLKGGIEIRQKIVY